MQLIFNNTSVCQTIIAIYYCSHWHVVYKVFPIQKIHSLVRTACSIYIIESVDSISRDGPDCPYM